MATSVQFRPHNRDLGMVVREVDEDLAIFLGMRNVDEFDGSTSVEPKPDFLLIPNGLGEEAFQILADDSLLNLETGKNDHDWLFAQQDVAADQAEIWNGDGIFLNSELANASGESAPPADSALQRTISNSLDSSAAASRRPASSGARKPASRAATPTGRTALPAKSKPSRASTPMSRASSRATTTSPKPMAAQVRSSTPSRATLPSSSSKPASRSSTPARATLRSSTPASRSSTIPASSKPASRSATPTRKPATPSTTFTMSPSDGGRKTGSVAIKNPVPTRGGSQKVKSRPSNPSDILYVSHDSPQTLKTHMPKRPASASRGRPSAPAAFSSSSNGKPRQRSCSPPAKARAPIITAHKTGITTLSRSRGYSQGGGEDVNPVLMGTKMVERVVNMRKLAPPKQDEHISLEKPKKSSHENSGFGRSLSNRSLDMAIRHMDIRRSVGGNLRPVATSVSSYFSSGNQSSSSQSSDSSKSSNCVNSYFLDGRQMDD